jgi:hypothetical protein
MTDNQNPYTTPTSPVGGAVSDIQIPIFKSWLIFFVFATIGSLVVGFVVGPLTGAVMSISDVPFQSRGTIKQIAVFIFTLPISFIAYRWTLNNVVLEKLLQKLPHGHKINGRSMDANG